MLNHGEVAALGQIRRVAGLALAMACAASAQTSASVLDGATPAALAPGDPISAYALSSFEHYSPFTGKPNIAVPLHHVGGRGTAAYDMMLLHRSEWIGEKETST